MRRKAYTLLLAFLLLWLAAFAVDRMSTAASAQESGFQTKAKAAVLIDASTGRVLYVYNADERLPMASTTKMMSALIALEQEDLESYFTVDSAAIHVEGSSMGLREGDRVSLETLAYGMLLPSGNDAAGAAAVRIAGSKEAFARMMNDRAAEIGLANTHFVTPSGLDDPEHYSSAYDLAQLAREALQNSRFAEICRQSKAKVRFGNPPYDRWLSNHNRLLKNNIGAIGVKTGFTDSAGRCLVSAVERDGITLIAVTLHCPDDWNEHTRLYDYYFDRLRLEQPEMLLPQVQVAVTGGVRQSAVLLAQPMAPVALLPEETLELAVTVQPFLYAPVRRDQVAGYVTFSVAGEPVAETALTVSKEIDSQEKTNKSLIDWLFGWS